MSVSSLHPSYSSKKILGETKLKISIEAGSIESSNTDVTTELTSMIKAQQLFSGASRLLQTEVEMLRSVFG